MKHIKVKKMRGWVVRAYDLENGVVLENKQVSARVLKRRCHELYDTPYSKIKTTAMKIA